MRNIELELNLKAFEEQLLRLLGEAGGRIKYATGRVGEVFSLWDTWADGVQAGYDRYGLKPFVVQPVFLAPIIHSFSRDLGFVG